MTDQFIVTETIGKVGLVRLNRPKELNALNSTLMEELVTALEAFDRDPAVGCLVITGNERAFAAGADIKEMAEASAVDMRGRPRGGHPELPRESGDDQAA